MYSLVAWRRDAEVILVLFEYCAIVVIVHLYVIVVIVRRIGFRGTVVRIVLRCSHC